MPRPDEPFGGLRLRHDEATAAARWRAILRALLRLACISIYGLGVGRAIVWALC